MWIIEAQFMNTDLYLIDDQRFSTKRERAKRFNSELKALEYLNEDINFGSAPFELRKLQSNSYLKSRFPDHVFSVTKL